MNRLSCGILAAVQLAGTCIAVAQAGTGLGAGRQAQLVPANRSQATPREGTRPTVPGNGGTSPAITISARLLDFGAVPVGTIKELSFMVQNAGASAVTGTANISPPFTILRGSPLVLKPAQTQVITVQYAPKAAGMHMTVVHLSGADGASVTVMGSAAQRVPTAPAGRPRAPTQPQGLRLIARHESHFLPLLVLRSDRSKNSVSYWGQNRLS